MILRILIVLVALTGVYTAWRAFSLHEAYTTLREAPQGQAIGPADAKLTVVELMDYRCKPCRAVNATVREAAQRHPDVRFVFRHRPIYQKPSVHEAQIALAAGKQGKFLAMHELLMVRDLPVDDAKDLPGLCQQAGVDCGRLMHDIHDTDIGRTIVQTMRDAELLKIKADPSFIIGHTVFDTHMGMPTTADFDNLIAGAQAGKF